MRTFCSEYPPLWYDEFNFNNTDPTFEDLKNFMSTNTDTEHYYINLRWGTDIRHSVYLPYGTKEIKTTIAHQSTVATYLLKINGTPSKDDVDVNTSPHDFRQCLKTNYICPYTDAIYDLYGYDILAKQVQAFCPEFMYVDLMCSHVNTLWQGKTFNAVTNTLILSVPNEFWNNHPSGAWLVCSWTGGVGGKAMSVVVNKNIFDSWYNSLSEQEKLSPITCPLDNIEQNVVISDFLKINSAYIENGDLLVNFVTSEIDNAEVYKWNFGDGMTKSTARTEISHEYKWNDIMSAKNCIQCSVDAYNQQGNIIASDSIPIFGLRGKIRYGLTLSDEDLIIKTNDPWKFLLWIKKQY